MLFDCRMDWLAHGKAAIVVAPQPDTLISFIKIGAPIKGIVPTEGTWISAGSSCLSWFNKAVHPNAARVFINGMLSQECQTAFSKAVGFHSTRVDVSTAHLFPGLARKEGEKYFDGTVEEAPIAQVATDKLGRDLFGPLIK